MRTHKLTKLTALSTAAGLLYASWPLGYLLNPTVARVSLASGLEAENQPYNWVFISIDIASSVLILLVCGLLWYIYRKRLSKRLKLSLVFVGLFAIGTVVDALLPERCVPNLMHCASFTEDPDLFIHGFFSILSSVCLFVALVLIWSKQIQSKLLNSLLAGYVLFGCISLVQAVVPGESGNWSQYFYITLCSAWIASLPFAIHLTTRPKV